MLEKTADNWGYCDSCSRWFACPRWSEEQATQPACPVCLSEPSRIENRAYAETQHTRS